MSCQACGTDEVSQAAQSATARLDRLPDEMQDVLRENFDGAIPVELCAECFEAQYANAVHQGLQRVAA